MTDFALDQKISGTDGGTIEPASRPNLDEGFNPLTMIIFFGILAAAWLFVAYSIYADVDATGTKVTCYLPYLLLLVALLIALGFEFVNGFHDTANAVATVIYTRSLPAEYRRGVVRHVQLSWRADVVRRGGFRHRVAAAGRTDPSGRKRRRLCDGFRPVDRRDHLEPRHLVFRPAGFQLAHPDRIDHRRRHHQRADARPRRHLRRRLVQATEIGYALLLSPLFGFIWRRSCCSSSRW